MKEQEFYDKFTKYIKSKDSKGANMVLMEELGRLIVQKRQDFIYVLKFSDITVPNEKLVPLTDVDLINLYLKNIDKNRKLILGTAFLISYNNKMTGFDGKPYASKTCADAMNKSMVSYFCGCSKGSSFDGDKMMSYFEGDPEFMSHGDGDASSGGISGGDYAKLGEAGLGLADAIVKQQAAKQPAAAAPIAALQAKQAAKAALLQGVVDAKKQQLANAAKLSDVQTAVEKSKRTKLIVIGVVGGVIVLGIATYFIVKAVKSKKG